MFCTGLTFNFASGWSPVAAQHSKLGQLKAEKGRVRAVSLQWLSTSPAGSDQWLCNQQGPQAFYSGPLCSILPILRSLCYYWSWTGHKVKIHDIQNNIFRHTLHNYTQKLNFIIIITIITSTLFIVKMGSLLTIYIYIIFVWWTLKKQNGSIHTIAHFPNQIYWQTSCLAQHKTSQTLSITHSIWAWS